MKDVSAALCEIAQLFESMQVQYAVMGGVAVRIYGIPRPTYDVDFTASLARKQLPDFFNRAIRAGYTVPEPYQQGWVDSVAGMSVVKLRLFLREHGVDVDIFLAESAFQKNLLTRRRCEDIDGKPIWFVSAEDLVLLKLIASRPRDLADMQDMLFMQGQLDEDYLRHWAQELGVLKRLEEVLSD